MIVSRLIALLSSVAGLRRAAATVVGTARKARVRPAPPWTSYAVPVLIVAVLAFVALTVRSAAVPGPLAAATPEPDATLKSQCIAGAAVGTGNDGLASDCALLLEARDTLRGTATLNWSAATAIADWTGITTAGTPQRVTRVQLTYDSLSGTIPAQLAGPGQARGPAALQQRADGPDSRRAGLAERARYPLPVQQPAHGRDSRRAGEPRRAALPRTQQQPAHGDDSGRVREAVEPAGPLPRQQPAHGRDSARARRPRPAQPLRGRQQRAHGLHPRRAEQRHQQRPRDAQSGRL